MIDPTRRILALCLVLLVGGWLGRPSAMSAQRIKGEEYIRVPDSTKTQIVRLTDGSTLVGRFVEIQADSLRFATGGSVITLRRSAIREVREAPSTSVQDGRYLADDPNPTRLFFGPTARSLPKGEGDFSNTYLFLLSGSYGLGARAQIGAGFSVVPFDDFSDNVFFVTGKVGVNPTRGVDLALGGLAGWTGTFGDDIGGDDGIGLGAVYGVGSFGSRDHAVTAGVIFPFAAGDVADDPLILLGGEARVSRRLKLVSENYITTGFDQQAIISYGLRIFGERIAVDLAFLNSTDEGVFPGIPYVDFVVRF